MVVAIYWYPYITLFSIICRGLEEVPDFRRFKNLQFLWLNKNKVGVRSLYLQSLTVTVIEAQYSTICATVLFLIYLW